MEHFKVFMEEHNNSYKLIEEIHNYCKQVIKENNYTLSDLKYNFRDIFGDYFNDDCLDNMIDITHSSQCDGYITKEYKMFSDYKIEYEWDKYNTDMNFSQFKIYSGYDLVFDLCANSNICNIEEHQLVWFLGHITKDRNITLYDGILKLLDVFNVHCCLIYFFSNKSPDKFKRICVHIS